MDLNSLKYIFLSIFADFLFNVNHGVHKDGEKKGDKMVNGRIWLKSREYFSSTFERQKSINKQTNSFVFVKF